MRIHLYANAVSETSVCRLYGHLVGGIERQTLEIRAHKKQRQKGIIHSSVSHTHRHTHTFGHTHTERFHSQRPPISNTILYISIHTRTHTIHAHEQDKRAHGGHFVRTRATDLRSCHLWGLSTECLHVCCTCVVWSPYMCIYSMWCVMKWRVLFKRLNADAAKAENDTEPMRCTMCARTQIIRIIIIIIMLYAQHTAYASFSMHACCTRTHDVHKHRVCVCERGRRMCHMLLNIIYLRYICALHA